MTTTSVSAGEIPRQPARLAWPRFAAIASSFLSLSFPIPRTVGAAVVSGRPLRRAQSGRRRRLVRSHSLSYVFVHALVYITDHILCIYTYTVRFFFLPFSSPVLPLSRARYLVSVDRTVLLHRHGVRFSFVILHRRACPSIRSLVRRAPYVRRSRNDTRSIHVAARAHVHARTRTPKSRTHVITTCKYTPSWKVAAAMPANRKPGAVAAAAAAPRRRSTIITTLRLPLPQQQQQQPPLPLRPRPLRHNRNSNSRWMINITIITSSNNNSNNYSSNRPRPSSTTRPRLPSPFRRLPAASSICPCSRPIQWKASKK